MAFEIKKYLIGILVFGLIFTSYWLAIVDMGAAYNVTMSSEYQDAYGNISATRNDMTDLSQSLRNSTRSTEADDEDQFGGSLLKGAFNSLRLIWNSFTSVNTIVEQTQGRLGIPDFWITGLVSIIIISITFAILSAVFKRDV